MASPNVERLGADTVQAVAERIRALGEGAPPYNSRNGACTNVARHVGDIMAYAVLGAAFEELGLDPMYPVTHPTMSAGEAYNSTDDLWVGEYGARRRAVCLKVAELLEKWLCQP